jgi:uncharacterized protein
LKLKTNNYRITFMDKEIINKLSEAKEYLARRYALSRIGVFGSIARGEESSMSDIDIVVDFTSTPDLFEFFEIEEYLENILHRKIDLVREKSIKKQIKDRVLREVIYI